MIVRERNRQLLVALLIYSEQRGYVHHSVTEVCRNVRLSFAEGLVELVIEQLVDGGYLQTSERLAHEPEPDLVFENTIKLTGKGLSSAEIWRGSIEREFSVPAADRYVSIDDNQRSAIYRELSALKSAIVAINDCDETDREIALAEIALFEQTIIQPRVPTELIERFVSSTLRWMLIAFANAAVAQAANSVFEAVRPTLFREMAA